MDEDERMTVWLVVPAYWDGGDTNNMQVFAFDTETQAELAVEMIASFFGSATIRAVRVNG